MGIKQFIGLSLAIAKAEFKLRNEGTWLGVFWYLLSPILTFLLLFLIFSDRLGKSIPDYPLYLLLGIILFNYFQKITDESIGMIRGNAGMIKSINFPKEALMGSVVLKFLFSHIFEMFILIIFILFFGISINSMIVYPLILFFISVFAFGAGLILASLEVYFIDLHNIWGFVSKLIWFGTPIFYAVEGQNLLGVVNLINPMYYFITLARELIIYTRMPQLHLIFGTIGFSLLSLITGIIIFNKLKPKFAELI